MIHSKVSDIIAINSHTWRTALSRIYISEVRRIIKIKCFAVAQAQQKPFSIYPVLFDFESNDIPFYPCEIIATPKPDLKITGDRLVERETYIVEGELSFNEMQINYNYISIQGYAHLLIPLAVSPKAFFVIEYEV